MLNIPLVVATLAVIVVGAITALVMAVGQSKANTVRHGAYFATVELATARIDAFDAKSNESLTLIARGSGQTYEASFQTLAANATAILDDAARRDGIDGSAQAFADYLLVHKQIRSLDDGGSWDDAVALATSGSAGANVRFAAFDSASSSALTAQAGTLNSRLGAARSSLPLVAWVGLLVGVLAAAAAGAGVGQRLREYR